MMISHLWILSHNHKKNRQSNPRFDLTAICRLLNEIESGLFRGVVNLEKQRKNEEKEGSDCFWIYNFDVIFVTINNSTYSLFRKCSSERRTRARRFPF